MSSAGMRAALHEAAHVAALPHHARTLRQLTRGSGPETGRSSDDLARLVDTLAAVPPERLVEHIGVPALLWLLAQSNAHVIGKGAMPNARRPRLAPLVAPLVQQGLDPAGLHYAASTIVMADRSVTADARPDDGTRLAAAYDVHQALSRPLHLPRLEEHVQASRRKGVALIPSEHVARLGVEGILTAEEEGGGGHREWSKKPHVLADGQTVYHHIYMDVPMGLLLTFDGWPQGIAGLYPQDDRTLFLGQLQGTSTVQGAATHQLPLIGVEQLHLAPLLARLSCDVARDLGFERLVVLSAVNSRWVKPTLSAIYDRTAKVLGATSKDRLGNRVIELQDAGASHR